MEKKSIEYFEQFKSKEIHTGYKHDQNLTVKDIEALVRDGRSPYVYSINTDGHWSCETVNVSIIFGEPGDDSGQHYIVTFETEHDPMTQRRDILPSYAFTDVYGRVDDDIARAQSILAIRIAQKEVDNMSDIDFWHFEEGFGFYRHFTEV